MRNELSFGMYLALMTSNEFSISDYCVFSVATVPELVRFRSICSMKPNVSDGLSRLMKPNVNPLAVSFFLSDALNNLLVEPTGELTDTSLAYAGIVVLSRACPVVPNRCHKWAHHHQGQQYA